MSDDRRAPVQGSSTQHRGHPASDPATKPPGMVAWKEPLADSLGLHLYIKSVLPERFQAFWERRQGYTPTTVPACWIRRPHEETR